MHSCSEVSSKCQHHLNSQYQNVSQGSGNQKYSVFSVTGAPMPVQTLPVVAVSSTHLMSGSSVSCARVVSMHCLCSRHLPMGQMAYLSPVVTLVTAIISKATTRVQNACSWSSAS